MYCSNCQCPSCHTQRAADFEKTTTDVIRLVKDFGDQGITASALRDYSRRFRALGPDAQSALLDALTMSGVLIKHRFLAPTRGKPRDAYLAAQVSQ